MSKDYEKELMKAVVALDTSFRLVKEYQLDCGDSSCYYKANGIGGMRTNGGCRCLRNNSDIIQRILRDSMYQAKLVLEDLAEEIAEYKRKER